MICKIGTVLACAIFTVYANPVESPTFANHRIVGGQVVRNRNEVPYQASIRIYGRHSCGGTIIDKEHILTAAHCCVDSNNKVLPPRAFTVVVGDLKLANPTNYTVKRDVKYVFTHSKYDPKTIANDVAVLRIKGNFGSFNNMTQPISLARSLPSASTYCKVSGWGVLRINGTIPNDLYAANVPIIDKTNCKRMYSKDAIKSGMFCAGLPQGGVDSCQGDSGGPLECNGVLAGVVSWGIGCALAGRPGVYTDVSEYSKWISKQQSRSSAETYVASLLIISAMSVLHLIRS